MSNYKQDYLAIKYDYETKCNKTNADISELIANFDAALKAYEVDTSENPSDANLKATFGYISSYYAELQNIKGRLNKFLESASTVIDEAEGVMVNEQRYRNRAEPEAETKPREMFYGFFTELRPSSIPVMMAAGVFMASLSLLMIFQMFGFTGQINVPPALTELPGKAQAAMGNESLSSNPMVLGGVALVVGVAAVIFGVMYFKNKQ